MPAQVYEIKYSTSLARAYLVQTPGSNVISEGLLYQRHFLLANRCSEPEVGDQQSLCATHRGQREELQSGSTIQQVRLPRQKSNTHCIKNAHTASRICTNTNRGNRYIACLSLMTDDEHNLSYGITIYLHVMALASLTVVHCFLFAGPCLITAASISHIWRVSYHSSYSPSGLYLLLWMKSVVQCTLMLRAPRASRSR
jgi:hypothetical protein